MITSSPNYSQQKQTSTPPFRMAPAATSESDPEGDLSSSGEKFRASHHQKASDAYWQLHGMTAEQGWKRRRPKRRWKPILLALMIFVIGAMAGLASARWLSQGGAGFAGWNSISRSAVNAAPAMLKNGVENMIEDSGSLLRGISPHELPHDRLQAMRERAGSAPERESITEGPVAGLAVAGKRVSIDGDRAAKPNVAKATTATTAQGATEKISPKTVVEKSVEKAKPVVKAAAVPATTRKRQASRHSSQGAKQREVRRIRQQAEDELKRRLDLARR